MKRFLVIHEFVGKRPHCLKEINLVFARNDLIQRINTQMSRVSFAFPLHVAALCILKCLVDLSSVLNQILLLV